MLNLWLKYTVFFELNVRLSDFLFQHKKNNKIEKMNSSRVSVKYYLL